jgi:hypothetical protein
MEMVEKKMFDEKGDLKNPRKSGGTDNNSPSQSPDDDVSDPGARVIRMNKK